MDWGWYGIYLLKKMEGEAKRRGRDKDFEKMVRLLHQELEK